MTAEMKNGKDVYYRCTGYKGACGNVYVREERLADLLGEVISTIQISPAVADKIATALRASDEVGEQRRCDACGKSIGDGARSSASSTEATKICCPVGFQRNSGRESRRSGSRSWQGLMPSGRAWTRRGRSRVPRARVF